MLGGFILVNKKYGLRQFTLSLIFIICKFNLQNAHLPQIIKIANRQQFHKPGKKILDIEYSSQDFWHNAT